MDHAEGAGSERCDRVEFRGAQLSSYGSLLVMREMEVFGLFDPAFTTVARTPFTGSTACSGSRFTGGRRAMKISPGRDLPGKSCRAMPDFLNLAALNAWLERRCVDLWRDIPHGAQPPSR
jgi:hypothetical protein